MVTQDLTYVLAAPGDAHPLWHGVPWLQDHEVTVTTHPSPLLPQEAYDWLSALLPTPLHPFLAPIQSDTLGS